MTRAELRDLRLRLGLTADGLAELVGVSGGRTVRRWEAGQRSIPGPVAVLLTAISADPAVQAYFGLTLSVDQKAA